jgi:L,D-transpeptidase YcbB
MPGVRVERFLVSTVVVLSLCAAAGSAFAEPKSGSMDAANATTTAPAVTPPSAAASGQVGEKPTEPPQETPAAPTKPQSAAEQPAAAESGKPQAAADQPASEAAAKPDESAEHPAAGAAAAPEQTPEQPAPAATAAKPEEPADQPAASATVVKPEESAEQPSPGATAAKPEQSTEQPAAGESPAKPQDATAQPAATTTPAESATVSDQASKEVAPPAAEAPAATVETPPAKEQPVAATGGDEVPAVPSASAATATPAVVSVDAAIADQLRGLADGKFDRLVGGKKDREAIDAFYSGRNYTPLWITDGKPNARATAAIAYLGQVGADALEPSDYPVPDFASLTDPAALAQAELRLTTSVVTYAHHAAIGRVHWTRVSGDISYDQKAPAPADVLAKMAQADNVGEALDSYEPHDPAYLALKAKLAELRAGKEEAERTRIPSGPMLKAGMQDSRVPGLRTRLGVSGDGTTYDKALAEAVKRFQQEHEIRATGMLTAATVEALNGKEPERPIDTIIANMERWRWMPHDLGETYVIVNLPDFTLRVMQDGKQIWKTKIVDGKPTMPTPIMTAEMKYITVNPTWNVPPSIVAREYMPALQQDPTVLQRMGLNVSTNPDGTVHISQPPGDHNALGRLRFNFPNKFLVYQHDTPDKQLFAYDRRAFSHGCMRVQDPVKYAEVLLSLVRPHDGYTQERIRKMFGNNEVDISFPTFVPVHLTYQTAFVDDEGKLEFRDDVYGRDKALLAILKSNEERKVADIPVERRDNTMRREVLAIPDQSTLWGGRSYGGNFFSRLFGTGFGAPPPPPAPTPRRHAARRTEMH